MKLIIITLLIAAIYNAECADLNMPKIKLASGHEMPIIGLGVWQLSGAQAHQAIKDAIDIGYRHIDTAFVYGNEADVGKAVNEAISAGTVKREDLFITSKIMPDNQKVHTSAAAHQAVKDALHKMNLKYLDLMLIHRPQTGYIEVYKGLEEAVKEGLVKSIGISEFHEKQVDDVLKHATVKPSINQIESHPYKTQDELIKYCKSHMIEITAYSPLGGGGHASLLHDAEIGKIAKAHNKSAAQVLLRYHVQKDVIVLTTSTNKAHLKENVEIFDFKLEDMEMTELTKLH